MARIEEETAIANMKLRGKGDTAISIIDQKGVTSSKTVNEQHIDTGMYNRVQLYHNDA